MSDYKSQLGQDRFIDRHYKEKTNGVYLDIGAHNGLDYSNTYFLEKYRGWSGILIEPMDSEFKALKQNRSSDNFFFNCAVGDYNGETVFTQIRDIDGTNNMISGVKENLHPLHLDRIIRESSRHSSSNDPFADGIVSDIVVPIRTIQDIMDETGLYEFDFCSLDTEGSELFILKGIDFDKADIRVFIIENNGYGSEPEITSFLDEKGYVKLCSIEWDDVYIKA